MMSYNITDIKRKINKDASPFHGKNNLPLLIQVERKIRNFKVD